MKRQTIKSIVSIKGIGLHTGKESVVTFEPADASHGIRFQRTDLESQPFIPADVGYVVSTDRGTNLKKGEAEIATVEHLLSAIAGLRIDNLLIKVSGPEIPIMDGSAKPFVDILVSAGMEEQDEEKEYLVIEETISFKDVGTGTEFTALPSDDYQITSLINFDSDTLGQQYAHLDSPDDFKTEVAPSRTFVFVHELEALLDKGLIRGGDMDNAIVIADKDVTPETLNRLAEKLNRPGLEIKKRGVLNTTKLRFFNEPARHKLLDIMGDLTLVGRPIRGKIIANKPGHRSNIEFAKLLKKKLLEQRKLKGKPKYDPNQTPVYDVNEVMALLPHRYPFLLVDKIIELSDTSVVGIKSVSINEALFQGHFPGNPVFPGVLQMEALAQTGGILALSKTEDPTDWDTYFIKMDNVKFKNKVGPGDTLILKMELLSPIRRGIVHMQGTAYVGNKIASEGELIAQLVKKS